MKPLNLTRPHLIIMVGIPGAGKSYFAEHFADTFKAPIINSEHIRKDLFTNPTFSKEEDQIISKVTDCILDQVLKTDRTVVYVGQTDTKNDRVAIANKTRKSGYEPLFVWVQTEPITAKKRATKKSGKAVSISVDYFNEKVKKFNPPNSNEKAIVISGKHIYASQLKIVLKRLVEPREKVVERVTAARPTRNRNILIR